jgi:ATP-binding cassette subfamily B protein
MIRALRSIIRLLSHTRPYWVLYLIGTLAVVGTNLCELATTFVVRYAVDAIEGQPAADTLAVALGQRFGAGQNLLYALAVALVLVVTVQVSLRFVWRWGFIFTSVRIARDLRHDLHVHLQKLESAFFDRSKTGELMSVGTADVEAMRMFLGIGLLLMIDTALYFCVVPLAMWRIDPGLTMILLAPLPLIPLATSWVGAIIHRRFTACQEQLATIAARAREAVAGIAVTKGYVQQQHEIASFSALSADSRARQIRLARVQAVSEPLLTLLVGVEIFLLLRFGGQAVLEGSLQAGELFQMLMMALMLTYPMMGLGWTITLLQRGLASSARYDELMSRVPAIADDPTRVSAWGDRQLGGAIALRQLTFTYPGSEQPALRDIELDIAAGMTVAFVGEVGCGKSTLVSLVPRCYDAPEGALWIDGVPIREIPLATLRAGIAIVPQEVFLFSAKLADNVAFSRPGASPAEIERAVWIAGLDSDVARLERGYETLLGERGINLSGGQRQRLAIARAVLADPQVLILDDCLSAVDTLTEELILTRLREFMAARTCLITAHRLSTVEHADLICVLERGRIVERGSHAELVGRGGWYATTWNQQQLAAEVRQGTDDVA